jgi:hypothetical protein
VPHRPGGTRSIYPESDLLDDDPDTVPSAYTMPFGYVDVEPEDLRVLVILVLGHETISVLTDVSHKFDRCFKLNDLHTVE